MNYSLVNVYAPTDYVIKEFLIKFCLIPIILYILFRRYNKKNYLEKDKDRFKKYRRRSKVILTLSMVLGFIYYFSPIWGYSQSFALSGYAMAPFTVDQYKNDPKVVRYLYGTIKDPVGRQIGACMTQEDFNKDINIMNDINKQRAVSSILYGVIDGKCQELKFNKTNGISLELSYTNKYNINNWDTRSTYFVSDEYTKVRKLNFKGASHIDLYLMIKDIKMFKKMKVSLEGVENLKEITIGTPEGTPPDPRYSYKLDKKGELEKFLKDWGWLDQDGYYGKKYKINEKIKKYKLTMDYPNDWKEE